jgi:glutathione S-transferase
MTYRLHGFAQSGNCYKVALYLACAGLPFEVVPVAYGNGETRDPAWREGVNAMGEAPVLEVDGVHMSQSGAILVYPRRQDRPFRAAVRPEQFEALRWMFFDNHKFTSFNATHRFFNAIQMPTDPDRR